MLTALSIITAVPVVLYLLWMVYSHRYATLRKHVPWRRYGWTPARGARSKRGTVATVIVTAVATTFTNYNQQLGHNRGPPLRDFASLTSSYLYLYLYPYLCLYLYFYL